MYTPAHTLCRASALRSETFMHIKHNLQGMNTRRGSAASPESLLPLPALAARNKYACTLPCKLQGINTRRGSAASLGPLVPVPERVARAVCAAGPSITLAAACEVAAFSVAAVLSDMPAVRAFAAVAALAVALDYVLQVRSKCGCGSGAFSSSCKWALGYACAISVAVAVALLVLAASGLWATHAR
eukprot:scaffold221350_cov22-Tisochrysis_lutea.AAC.1